MKVKLLVSRSGPVGSGSRGDVIDVEDVAEAQRMFAAGHGEPVEGGDADTTKVTKEALPSENTAEQGAEESKETTDEQTEGDAEENAEEQEPAGDENTSADSAPKPRATTSRRKTQK